MAKQSLAVGKYTEHVTFDISNHSSGVYHVRVVSEDGVKSLKVVISR